MCICIFSISVSSFCSCARYEILNFIYLSSSSYCILFSLSSNQFILFLFYSLLRPSLVYISFSEFYLLHNTKLLSLSKSNSNLILLYSNSTFFFALSDYAFFNNKDLVSSFSLWRYLL